MWITVDDPRAAYYDVYLWDGTQWLIQDRCLEAEDGRTGFVRVEIESAGRLREARYTGSVKFVRKPRIDKPRNPVGWGKKLLAPDEEMP